jgi:hypothetical protein
MPPVFIITIDTEGDNIWAHPNPVTTENARHLPRFQELCEKYGFAPTYLVDYEMAIDRDFQRLGRDAIRRRTGEIGLHIHPWYSPPPAPESTDPRRDHIYLFELPDDALRAKIHDLTKILQDTFEIQPTSHRAGRWGFDARVARALIDAGYLTDCSVTPGVSWKKHLGSSSGGGGTDYFGYPETPYFLDPSDIRREGRSPLLEVPVTIRQNYPAPLRTLHHRFESGRIGRLVRRHRGSPVTWLRPNGKNVDAMLSLVDWAVESRRPVLEFMLHSSEFMPGGSPTFATAEQVEGLYADLTRLFAYIAGKGIPGRTLSDFRAEWVARAA